MPDPDALYHTHILPRLPALALYARHLHPRDPAAADDALQDALARLFALPHAPDDPPAWLFRALRNAAIDHHRAATARRRREQTLAQHTPEHFLPTPDAPLDAAAATAALATLPHDAREIVLLRLWSDLTYPQIAAVTNLSPSTVHHKYTAALATLRRTLEPPCRTTTTILLRP